MLLSDLCTVSGIHGVARGYAKVNLTLDVLEKRPDGYHDIVTVMRSINLYDTVTAEMTKKPGFFLTTSLHWLPTDEKNIAYKAAMCFFEEVKVRGGVKIHITKTIPCGAGMGGGSADGAAVLALLNRLYGNPLSDEKLLKIGGEIGADVPFCLMGGTAVATGIGDKLRPVNAKGTVPVLVVKPEASMSTPEMYKLTDKFQIIKRPDTELAVAAVEKGDIRAIAQNLCNVMEGPAISMYPVIGEIRNKMLQNGALGAMMTGSGSAVFGVFSSVEEADECAKCFEGNFEDIYSTILL